jgi:NAD(P)-dependent dehydrogenase (short-subunit alcohol dehydrogenase family)
MVNSLRVAARPRECLSRYWQCPPAGAGSTYREVMDNRAQVAPVQAKEIVYQAVPYAGMGKVFDFIHATNDVLSERGVRLPLDGQATTTPATRAEKGRAVREQKRHDPKELVHHRRQQRLRPRAGHPPARPRRHRGRHRPPTRQCRRPHPEVPRYVPLRAARRDHATKWGIEGFAESVAQEVAPFGIGVTIVEPGGARTEFRYGSARVADLLPAYDGTPAHGFLTMLDPANGLAPGDPARMAAAIIASVDQQPAPLRIVLGSQALQTTVSVLKDRIASFEAQTDLAASTDFPPGE